MVETSYLKRLEVKVKLTKGEKCEDATDHWVHNELVQLKEKRIIKLS
jgi:hypothetical protein